MLRSKVYNKTPGLLFKDKTEDGRIGKRDLTYRQIMARQAPSPKKKRKSFRDL